MVPLGDAGTFAGASWAEDGSIFVGEALGKGLLHFPPPEVRPKSWRPGQW